MKEYRIYGPPGTGKTRVLARRHIPRAVEKYGPDKVMVTSFTRAAAREIAGRDIQVNERNVGTLHSICFHAFRQPDLAIKHLKKWNEEHPRWPLSKGGRVMDDYDDAFEPQMEGDKLMSEIQVLKAKLVPPEIWKMSLQSFKKAWDGFKKELNVLDFDDLIENALEEFPIAPNNPAVMFLDEAQDFTPIQFKLIRLWGMSMEWFVMAGDDDQTLYAWLGSNPEALINPPVPKEFKTVLNQSWRVPAKVLEIANRVISKVSIREPKEYRPRMDDELESVPGEVIFHDDHYKYPDEVLELALEYIKQPSTRPGRKNKDVMFLASCSYMLEPLKKILRDQGIPFHNPYRRQRYDWNPFYRSKGVSSVDLLSSFLSQSESDETYWSVPQFLKWAQFIKVGETGLIKKQGKEALKVLNQAVEDCVMGIHTTREVLHNVLSPGAINAALNRDVGWLENNILKSRSGGLIYPLSVLKNQGCDALREEPNVLIGTVHCSPANEPILTSKHGYVSIGQLNPNVHRLPGYNSKCNRLSLGSHRKPFVKSGYVFTKTSRQYQGELITVKTAASETRITPNHRVQVKFSSAFMEKYVVYLMRRGDWWRVGICVSAHRPYRSGGIGGRLATEQADAGWILGVFKTREEAVYEEAKIQGLFGIPGLTFETARARVMRKKQIHSIHEITKAAVNIRVRKLLNAYALDERYPLYTRASPGNGVRKRNLRSMFLTRACNLISDYMKFPIVPATFFDSDKGIHKPEWLPIKIKKEHFNGKVYSLNVPPHHHYISSGAIVHNSFKGAESDVVIVFPDLSKAAYSEMDIQENEDAIRRMFYVAMTRAYETLILCSPVPTPRGMPGMYFEWPE